MTTHAALSPSSAYRFMRCPGSVREQAKYPEKPSGPGAVDGTHTHTLLEHCIKGVFFEAVSFVGSTLADHEGSFIVDADRAKRVQVALDHVNSIGAVIVIAEQRVNPAHLIGRDDMSGTVDIQVHTDDTLHVIDYKDGMNEVEAKDNEQLELYALGVLAGFKLPINGDYPFKYVTMTIIQPKLAVKGANPITSHTMTVREVLDLIPKYVSGGAAVDDPDAPLNPGDKQCKYCRASGCSARAQDAFKMFNITFPQVPDKEDKPFANIATLAIADLISKVEALPDAQQVSDQVAAQDPASMTSDQLRQILEAAPLMRQTIEQAEAEAQRRLESGQSVPGVKLVYGRGSQAWAIPEDQVVEKLKGMGVPKDTVYKTSVVSPAQAKKLVWTKRDGTTKQLSERQLKTLETEYIAKLGGKLTVALESDPRAAVVRDAAPLFSAVEVTPETPALPSWLS
jgi:hypothetical protein